MFAGSEVRFGSIQSILRCPCLRCPCLRCPCLRCPCHIRLAAPCGLESDLAPGLRIAPSLRRVRRKSSAPPPERRRGECGLLAPAPLARLCPCRWRSGHWVDRRGSVEAGRSADQPRTGGAGGGGGGGGVAATGCGGGGAGCEEHAATSTAGITAATSAAVRNSLRQAIFSTTSDIRSSTVEGLKHNTTTKMLGTQ